MSLMLFCLLSPPKIEHREEEVERLATIESLKGILYPKSIAVVGASRYPGTIVQPGRRWLKAAMSGRFTGEPERRRSSSIKTYPSVTAIPVRWIWRFSPFPRR